MVNYISRSSLEISIYIILFCVVLSTFIVMIMLYQIFCGKINQKRKNKMQRFNKLILCICIMASTLCQWCDFIRHLICYVYHKDIYYYPLNNIMCISDLFYYIAAISFYIIAVSRLQISFRDTTYAMNTCTLSFFYSLICISFGLSIYYVIFVSLQPPESVENGKKQKTFFDKYETIPIFMIMCNDAMINIGLLFLFVKKLRDVLSDKLMGKIEDKNSMNDNNDNKVSIDGLDQNLLTLISRHTLLFGTAIITNQIWFLGLLFQNGIISNKLTFDIYVSPFCFRSLENMANCIVLFLGLRKNNYCYLLICGCCHKRIEKCFKHNVNELIHSHKRGLLVSSSLPYNDNVYHSRLQPEELDNTLS